MDLPTICRILDEAESVCVRADPRRGVNAIGLWARATCWPQMLFRNGGRRLAISTMRAAAQFAAGTR